jgi:hypothetical protein
MTHIRTIEPVIVCLGAMALGAMAFLVVGMMAAVLVANYGWHLI